MDSFRDSIATLYKKPVRMKFDGVFVGSTFTIPSYNLWDSTVKSSGTTQAICLDTNKSGEAQEALDESALLQALETIVSFPRCFL
jgi:protein involved in temperature-dependent protein secretion